MGARRGARDRALGRRLRFPRSRARLRAGRAAPPGRIPVQRGPDRLQPRARHRRRRLRRCTSRRLHVERSTALHSRLRERGAYLVGPLARYSLNFDRLSPLAAGRGARGGAGPSLHQSLPQHHRARGGGALRLRRGAADHRRLRAARPPAVAVEPRAGVGCAATEAPRGLLYHRYRLEADGTIAEARIVPPTSQNQASIEEDLASFVGGWLDLPEDGRCAIAASRPCATTTRASPAPPISCGWRWIVADGAARASLVMGVGNPDRGDDGAGRAVAPGPARQACRRASRSSRRDGEATRVAGRAGRRGDGLPDRRLRLRRRRRGRSIAST